jgi:alpha-amylase
MGVSYHAHARFLDRHGNRITVPAPSDPQTPRAAWWYDWIAMNAASLRRAGFTAILYPPVCKTQSGHFNTGDGYGVYDQYDIGSKNQMGSIETRFGNREQLQRSIAIAHACGLDVYVDVVLHQLIGGNNGVYRYSGANGAAGTGRFPKNPGCFRGAPPRRPQDPVPVPSDDFSFGDELVYVNCDPPGYTIDGMIDFGDWLTRSLDCQGYRVDDTKGMAVAFVKRWMNAKAMTDRFCVSEYFDGSPQNLSGWAEGAMGGRSLVFDFTTRFGLQRMCDDGGFDMRGLDGLGYTALDPLHSATFVDNPDTDLSPGEQVISNKLLAYAFILTTEGYPFVYHKDYSTEPGCYGLKPWIDNLVWIHENLASGRTLSRYADQHVFVHERLGQPGLLTAINKDPWDRHTITCSTNFGANASLHDYTGRHPDIRTDGEGRATFTVPSNAFGSGQSYLCFSRQGFGAAPMLRPRNTTQVFFGADDLDIAAARDGDAIVGRIWAADGTHIAAELRGQLRPWPEHASLTVELLDTGGAQLASARVTSSAAAALQATVRRSGWHTFKTTGTGLPHASGAPFELSVSYTATQELALR